MFKPHNVNFPPTYVDFWSEQTCSIHTHCYMTTTTEKYSNLNLIVGDCGPNDILAFFAVFLLYLLMCYIYLVLMSCNGCENTIQFQLDTL